MSELLHGIPLLNLWDNCFLFAKDLLYEGSVPDEIKKNNIKYKNYRSLDIERNSEEEAVLLNPIQQWLSEQLIKSIEKKEINPKIVGRFIDGKINPKRTYVDGIQIEDWFLCRGINAIAHHDGYGNFNDFFERSLDFILCESSLLSTTVYDTDFEISTLDSREKHQLIAENALLKAKLDKALSHQHAFPKKTHRNSELNAQNRQQVLGAAFAVLGKWPDECKDNKGNLVASKITRLIDQKANLFWPEAKPPLAIDTIETLLRDWIKKANATSP